MNTTQRCQELMIVKEIHEKCLSQYLSKEETILKLYYYENELVKKGKKKYLNNLFGF